jgi:hypothetical protein
LSRILLIAFQQALRSVALILLPLSFIALFAWSTAGSATGNTSDPIRAAIWMWLGSHLVPFKLSLAAGFSTGALSYLPIGAAILPWLAIRSGFKRASEFSNNPRGSRTFVIFFYTVIATLAATFSQSENIKPDLILTPVFVLILGLSATINYQSSFFHKFKFITYAFMSLLGLSTLAIGVSLILHFEIVKSLAIVIQPGIMGGILFTILQLLYLPNFALAGLSYFFGPGFSLGLGTLISPITLDLNSLPAIPLLGSLPTTEYPLLLIALIVPVLIVALNQLRVSLEYKEFKVRQSEILLSAIPFLILITLFSFFAGGTLITQDMDPVGVTWWKLPALFGAIQLLTLIFGLYLPKLVKVIRSSKSEI